MPYDVDNSADMKAMREKLKKTYKNISDTAARQAIHVFNSVMDSSNDEGRAWASVYSALNDRGLGKKQAGRGLELPEVYQAVFGSSPSAKAFRSLVKHMSDKWYKNPEDVPPEVRVMAEAASPTLRAIRTSQALKTAIGGSAVAGYFPSFGEADPVMYSEILGSSGLRELKKLLELQVKGKVPTLSGLTKKFLRDWVDTNARSMPRPMPDTVYELEPYRPDGTQILYRGIRFQDVGELVEFAETYGEGKPFPFSSTRFTAWSKSIDVAERFGRYRAATSQNDAMMGWLSMAKNQKDYHGQGGYVIGARVRPQQCLVDIGKTGVLGQHGNEEEVIVLPDQALVCKVYKVFGDVLREVEDFKTSREANNPPKEFLQYVGLSTKLVGIEGDVATFEHEALRDYDQNTPKGADGDRILKRFRANLYKARWIDDYRVRFEPMDLPSASRVASRYASVYR